VVEAVAVKVAALQALAVLVEVVTAAAQEQAQTQLLIQAAVEAGQLVDKEVAITVAMVLLAWLLSVISIAIPQRLLQQVHQP
jgi:hypothetical protein